MEEGKLLESTARATAATAVGDAKREGQEEGGALEVTPEAAPGSERGEGEEGGEGGGAAAAVATAAAVEVARAEAAALAAQAAEAAGEEATRVQKMLEGQLREAEASAAGSKEALEEMEGVVAGLREEGVSLCRWLLDTKRSGVEEILACLLFSFFR